MIGPYYKPQLTSILSITSRLTGVFLTVISMPLLLWWLIALMVGPEAFATVNDFLAGILGRGLVLISLMSLCYHLMNGIRHLVWDTGRMLEIKQVYQSGWLMLAASVVLFSLTLWISS
ncbi:MAG: succinate dehydrogenase / fumarate reductase cytochrome b subunit [Bacteroidia bacterium]|jgi:succinate dehydrogenase / fumarate reductase cytochrome b subunit